ncbi:hypothetical protein HYFRA_00001015 [Hymenoscyphus fraxineus]|uniref:Phosphoglycerate mutase-like protein n=1 Tax=Hymenoscyphus fraxineus TaxID=746836 RepID=A0A9N9KSF9_9HELO|nr:hypothetical protein HYFRA_00001015 [Hymenoscyphus fraxineus]
MASSTKPQTRQDIVIHRQGGRGIFSVNCLIPIFFLATIITALLIIMGEAQPAQVPMASTSKTPTKYLEYSIVEGYFQQSDPVTEDKNFDYTKVNFGLVDRSYEVDGEIQDQTKTQWERFELEVARLNRESEADVQYKVLFMGRHGEGYHNLAEAFYGTHDWDCYWSLQNGNSTTTWSDALLTPTGESQALAAHAFWKHQLTTQSQPSPQTYYTSPLLRCLRTAFLTFTDLPLPPSQPFKPLIKELIREAIGVHTCDRRSSKSIIAKAYPEWEFEEGFTEGDEWWDAELRESDEAMDRRLRMGMDQIFGGDGSTWISISSHSGAIGAILRVFKHRKFALGTGQVIPVFVRAEEVIGEGPPREKGPYTTVPTCSKPPDPTPA